METFTAASCNALLACCEIMQGQIADICRAFCASCVENIFKTSTGNSFFCIEVSTGIKIVTLHVNLEIIHCGTKYVTFAFTAKHVTETLCKSYICTASILSFYIYFFLIIVSVFNHAAKCTEIKKMNKLTYKQLQIEILWCLIPASHPIPTCTCTHKNIQILQN